MCIFGPIFDRYFFVLFSIYKFYVTILSNGATKLLLYFIKNLRTRPNWNGAILDRLKKFPQLILYPSLTLSHQILLSNIYKVYFLSWIIRHNADFRRHLVVKVNDLYSIYQQSMFLKWQVSWQCLKKNWKFYKIFDFSYYLICGSDFDSSIFYFQLAF